MVWSYWKVVSGRGVTLVVVAGLWGRPTSVDWRPAGPGAVSPTTRRPPCLWTGPARLCRLNAAQCASTRSITTTPAPLTSGDYWLHHWVISGISLDYTVDLHVVSHPRSLVIVPYTRWTKTWHLFGIWVSTLARCIIFAIFVCSRIIFIKWRWSSSAGVNIKFCFMPINCNFVTTVGLTNDKRCLIHHLRVEKHWGSEIIPNMLFYVSNKRAHLDCE